MKQLTKLLRTAYHTQVNKNSNLYKKGDWLLWLGIQASSCERVTGYVSHLEKHIEISWNMWRLARLGHEIPAQVLGEQNYNVSFRLLTDVAKQRAKRLLSKCCDEHRPSNSFILHLPRKFRSRNGHMNIWKSGLWICLYFGQMTDDHSQDKKLFCAPFLPVSSKLRVHDSDCPVGEREGDIC